MTGKQSYTPESPFGHLTEVMQLRVADLYSGEENLAVAEATVALRAAGTRLVAGEVVKQG